MERRIINETALLRALYSNVNSRLSRRSLRSVVVSERQQVSNICGRRLSTLEKKSVKCIELLKVEEESTRHAGGGMYEIKEVPLQNAEKILGKIKKLRRDMLKIGE